MEDLDVRQNDILRLIVQEHISTGEPVGSTSIAGRDLPVSPATVRGVMADLEELGFLEKPHTSAGRVPTERGYRYYVDTLVQVRSPSKPERDLIERSLPQSRDADEVLRETTRLLSSLSHHAAVVTLPSLEKVPLERLELVPLKDSRVLAILVARSGVVRNLLLVDLPLGPAELEKVEGLLNELVRDAPLDVLRERLVTELARERSEYETLEKQALELGKQVVDAAGAGGFQVHIQGRESFFEAPEFADVKRMRDLFAALEEKSKLLEVLDRTLSAKELKIFIGADTEFSARTGASVVAAPYATGSGVIGSVGIIGPTRMNYSRAIALVDYTARIVSQLLDR
ncbi:MAG TPA: heat-inducible transcriptional repressor HrcA [Myxococcales bacterium]|jgi:heat-inducible transcriptional repressor